MDEQPPVEYLAYNGLGRSPMIWGIPFMTGLLVMCISLVGGVALGTFVGGAGWLFALIGVPILLFVKLVCTNDDQAVRILLLDAKWSVIKLLSGDAKAYGDTLTFHPIDYGQRTDDVEDYFRQAVGRTGSSAKVPLSRS